jgi:CHAT domain-containing protein
MRLLAFGDPYFGEDAPVPRLRRSGREARLVARYAPESVVRLHEDASAAYLKKADLAPFRVIHFATHTLVDEHTAARTALILAPRGGDGGRVGPGDLASLRLNADLVVLSSCRSGGGVVINGEGVQGLIAPLLQAGARSVVATQWEIGDRGAVKFVEMLYRHLADGRPVGEALRLAKLDAIKERAPPQEWAAFTVLGDPSVQVPLRAPRWWQGRAAVPLAVGAVGAVLAVLYWGLRRRGRTGETS